jgi:hypothetical protein
MLELQGPMLEGLGRARHLDDDEEEEEEEEEETPLPSPVVSLGGRGHQLRFSERCRSRLLQQKFKAKASVGAATKTHHHRAKDAQRRGSTIARVWDTLATVSWSSLNRTDDVLIARLEQIRRADAAFRAKCRGSPPPLFTKFRLLVVRLSRYRSIGRGEQEDELG